MFVLCISCEVGLTSGGMIRFRHNVFGTTASRVKFSQEGHHLWLSFSSVTWKPSTFLREVRSHDCLNPSFASGSKRVGG